MLLKHITRFKSVGLLLFVICFGSFSAFSNKTSKTIDFNNSNPLEWYTHVDTDLGFTVQLPEAPNYTDEYDRFTIYSYNKPNAKTVFSFFALDFRKLKSEKDDQTIVDEFINNTVSNLGGELLDKQKLNYADGMRFEILVKVNDAFLMRSQLTFQNNIMFYLSVEDLKDNMKAEEIDAFFESLHITKPKVLEVKPLITHVNKTGAFSIKIPKEPKDVSRDVANPLDEEGDPYVLNMYVSTDLENNDNFLFRYNDQPLGYYVQDLPESFDEMQTVLSSTSEIISEPKIISLDGYEGREYELLLTGKYHSICRVYFRGNRTYLLLKQKLNTTDKVSSDHPFFNDFKFEPYQSSQPVKLRPKDTNFEVLFYDEHRVVKDSTSEYTDTYLISSTDYFAKNPSTGALYQLSYSPIRDYFKIDNKKEFFDTNIEAIKEWNDSVVDLKQIKVNGIDAAAFNLVNETTKVTTRHQIWLDGERLLIFSGYLGKDELHSTLTDSIFGSYKVVSNPTSFDYFSSKSDLILNDLKSKDSLTYTNAFAAFSYYVFDPETDVSKLHKALKEPYADATKTQAIKVRIVDEFADTNDDTTLAVIEELYTKDDTNDDLKTAIITTIPYLKNDNRLEVYKSLLFQSPPTSKDSYNWSTLSPFRDSLDFAIANYKAFIGLVDHEIYRDDVINIVTSIIEDKKEDTNVVTDHLDVLFKHLSEDIKSYTDNQKNAEDDDYDYTYNAIISAYLDMLNKVNYASEATDAFTTTLIQDGDNKWFQLLAITARIFNNQDFEKSFLEKKMDSLFYRLEIMQAYHKTNQFKAIPKKYLKPEAFSKLSVFNYVVDDNTEPDQIKTLGKLDYDNQTYYAFSIDYNTEDSTEITSYMAIVGPIETISEDTELTRYTSYSEWEAPERLKAQAIKMLPDLVEYGY